MKNYLEHEVEVKFIDNILVKNQEWQWFVDCIEESFDLNDIMIVCRIKAIENNIEHERKDDEDTE